MPQPLKTDVSDVLEAPARPSLNGGSVDIAKTIAEEVAKMAGKKVAGFIFAQVGLDDLVNGPQANFDAIKAQLEGISNQITDLQKSVDSISSELARIELNQYTEPMNRAVTTINTVYTKFNNTIKRLIPYAEEERAAAAAGKTCDDFKACVKLRETYTDYVHDVFLPAVNAEAVQEANRVIHDHLVPNPQGQSALIAFGRVLMVGDGSTGFLTAADSDKLFTMYRYYADYEALATLMKGQALALDRETDSSEFDEFLDEEVFKFQADEQKALPHHEDGQPARIPSGTVISLPVALADRHGTKNQPMWLLDASAGLNTQWDPSAPAGTANTVPAALQTINSTSAGLGFSDWRVPSKPEWDGFFSGRSTAFPNADGLQFFGKLVPNSAPKSPPTQLQGALTNTGNPYVWTTGPAMNVECYITVLDEYNPYVKIGELTDYTHAAIPVSSSASLANYPGKFPPTTIPNIGTTKLYPPRGLSGGNAGALKWCKDTAAAMVTKALAKPNAKGNPPGAQLVPTRQTDVNYIPVP